ncbi:MAG: tRNA (adenosine(37)-N6)-threonylcarbamoyltransferase complex ATPase subunit type 1 TsaE [bacterium]|nr:tRNA (adenosine(37)-N6)-threonylcarbamoyltransferase complex ATPase subunit type 1 TsaE [bacterium]
MKKENITSSANQTKKLAEKIARKIIKKEPETNAFVIGLKGDLGGGKTTFVQGFARGLGIKEKILSPTFVIYKKFKILNYKLPTINYKLFYHFDCYRIKNSKEILGLGFKEIISNPQNIVVIEWADKIKKIMPKNTFWISFDFINESTRKITL